MSSHSLRVWIEHLFLLLASTAIVSGSSAQETTVNLITEAHQLQGEGRFAEAERVLLHALQEAKRRDVNSVEVAVLSDNLATVLEDLGRYSEAIQQYLTAARLLENSIGLEAETSLRVRNHLAALYVETHQFSKAEALLQKNFEIEERKHGTQDLSVAELFEILGTLYQMDKSFSDAEAPFRNALGIYRRLLPTTDFRIATALTNLGWIVEISGRHAEAASYAEQSGLILDGQVDAAPAATVIKTLTVLGVAYSKLSSGSLAEPYLAKALRKAEAVYGPNHPNVAYVLQNYAAVMRQWHKMAPARSMESRAKRILAENQRGNHLDGTVDFQSLLPPKAAQPLNGI